MCPMEYVDLVEFPISRLTSLQELDNYRVKESIGTKISAIRSLRDLRELKLQCIENVVNHEEAKNAKLQEKHLNSLSLNWSACTGAQNRRDDLVLDHLEPHGNIRELEIFYYEGLKPPIWIENMSVKSLVSLRLESCINWEHLPSLGELVSLKHLKLDNLPKLKQIGQSSHMSSSSSMEILLPPSLDSLLVSRCQELSELPILPPSLLSLHILLARLTKLPMIDKIFSESIETKPSKLQQIIVIDCPYLTSLEGSLLEQKLCMGALCVLKIRKCLHLESASIPFEEMNELRELDISSCPKLRTIRDAKDKLLLSSLTRLTMGQCGDLELPLLGSLQRLTNLSWLSLQNCSRLVSLPSAEVFTSIKSLQGMHILECENLSSLGGLGSLPSLRYLAISTCIKLVEAGSSVTPDASGGEEEHLVQIHWLRIDLPSLLLVEPLKSFCHTQQLDILDGSEMESLPERWLLQNHSSLQFQSIQDGVALKSRRAKAGDLPSLKKLNLRGAGQSRSLSDQPRIRDLPSLQELLIEGSPERNKISHMLRVEIGGSYFIMGKECNRETYHKLWVSDHTTLTSWANQLNDEKRVESLLSWWKEQCCPNAS